VVNGSPTKIEMVKSAEGCSQLTQLRTVFTVLIVLMFQVCSGCYRSVQEIYRQFTITLKVPLFLMYLTLGVRRHSGKSPSSTNPQIWQVGDESAASPISKDNV